MRGHEDDKKKIRRRTEEEVEEAWPSLSAVPTDGLPSAGDVPTVSFWLILDLQPNRQAPNYQSSSLVYRNDSGYSCHGYRLIPYSQAVNPAIQIVAVSRIRGLRYASDETPSSIAYWHHHCVPNLLGPSHLPLLSASLILVDA